MAQVFSAVPCIYGFSSIGPSGKNAEPLLNKYFNHSKKEYNKLNSSSGGISTSRNEVLFSALKNTAIAQASGANFSNNTSQNLERPYCYLRSESKPILDKLKYISTLLLSPNSLLNLPYITKYLEELNAKNYSFTQDEESILTEIQSNKKIRNDFQRILTLKGHVYLKIRTDVFKLMRDLKIISLSDFNDHLQSILQIDFSNPITTELKDLVCSAEVTLPRLNYKNADLISLSTLNTQEVVRLITCLKPKDDDTINLLLMILKNNEDYLIRIEAIEALGLLAKGHEHVQIILTQAMINDSESSIRNASASALMKMKPTSQRISQILVNLIKDGLVRKEDISSAVIILGTMNPQELLAQQVLIIAMKSSSDHLVRLHAVNSLGSITPTNPTILQHIYETSTLDESNLVRETAKKYLIK